MHTISPKHRGTLNTCSNNFIPRYIKCVMSIREKIALGVAVRGEGGVAGERRVVGVPKFHSWGKCTVPLTNINSDSTGLCISYLYCIIFAGPLFILGCNLIHLQESGNMTAFKSPIQAIAKTIVQLSGEFDFEVIFNQGTLLNGPTTYILFFIFLMTGPILFSNFLVSCCCMHTFLGT